MVAPGKLVGGKPCENRGLKFHGAGLGLSVMVYSNNGDYVTAVSLKLLNGILHHVISSDTVEEMQRNLMFWK